MYYLISITLLGISFAPFIFANMDMWNAQGLWSQLCLMVLFSFTFFLKPKNEIGRNLPLGLLHLWIGLFTCFFAFKAMNMGRYDTAHFFPYFNFLCAVIFISIVEKYITRNEVEKILMMMRYVIILTLIVCVLQYIGYSQFFYLLKHYAPGDPRKFMNNVVSGFLANGTHLSGFLGSCVPLFLYRNKREDYLGLFLMVVVLSTTGTTIGDPSISGYVVGYLVTLFFIKANRGLLIAFIVTPLVGLLFVPHINSQFFGLSGRHTVWSTYWELFKQVPVTGAGLGGVRMISPHTNVPTAKHLHFEFFHFTFELGLIGAVLIINLINDFFKDRAGDNLELTLKSLVLGFLLSSCFAYPAHLWLPAMWVCFFYASYRAIKEIKC